VILYFYSEDFEVNHLFLDPSSSRFNFSTNFSILIFILSFFHMLPIMCSKITIFYFVFIFIIMTDWSVIFILSKNHTEAMNTSQGIPTSGIWCNSNRPSYLTPRYPDLRFSCVGCGSLDVFIKGNQTIQCLECNKTERIA